MDNEKKIVQAWTKALESGEYRQTTGKLRKTVKGKTSHCCLGVLCEVVTKELPEQGKWKGQQFMFTKKDGDESLDSGELPWTLRAQFPWLDQFVLIHMNDSEGKSFKVIAKTIRAMYKARRV